MTWMENFCWSAPENFSLLKFIQNSHNYSFSEVKKQQEEKEDFFVLPTPIPAKRKQLIPKTTTAPTIIKTQETEDKNVKNNILFRQNKVIKNHKNHSDILESHLNLLKKRKIQTGGKKSKLIKKKKVKSA